MCDKQQITDCRRYLSHIAYLTTSHSYIICSSLCASLAYSSVENMKAAFPTSAFQTQAILDALQDPPRRLFHYIQDLPSDVNLRNCNRRATSSRSPLISYASFSYTAMASLSGRLENFKPNVEQFECRGEDSGSFINALCEKDLRGGKRTRFRYFIHSFLGRQIFL